MCAHMPLGVYGGVCVCVCVCICAYVTMSVWRQVYVCMLYATVSVCVYVCMLCVHMPLGVCESMCVCIVYVCEHVL